MKPPSQWSFPYLNSFSPWALNTTIAYWIGIFIGVDPRIKLPFDYTWPGLMSLQIDMEGQACHPTDLWPMPDVMPVPFRPFAPVAFSKAWSPLPLLCDRLGTPDVSELNEFGGALVFWKSPRAWKPLVADAPPGDVKHCHEIVQATQAKASKANAGLLCIASPGWNYDDDDLINNEITRQAYSLTAAADALQS